MNFESHVAESHDPESTHNIILGWNGGVELPKHVVRSTLIGCHSGRGLEGVQALFISDGAGNLKLVVDEKGHLYFPNIATEPGPSGSVYSDNGYLRISP